MMNTKRFLVLSFILLFAATAYSQLQKPRLKGKKVKFEYKGEQYVFTHGYRKDVPQQGITSEMHRENVGKIIFSNEKIQFQNEDPSKVKTRLKAGDHIYGRAYMICSIANDTVTGDGYTTSDNPLSLNPNKKIKRAARGEDDYRSASAFYRLYINGELSNWNIQSISFTEKSLQYSTRQVWLAPKPEDETVSDYWLEILDDLPEGEHDVRVELYSGQDGSYGSYRPLAAGEFTLVKGSNDALSTGLKFADLDEARKDPALAKQIVTILNEKARDYGWEMTFKKVKMNTDWVASYVSTNNSGVTKIREIRVYGFATYPDGKCITEEFTIAQGHNGSEFSGPIFYRQVIPGSKKRIDCE